MKLFPIIGVIISIVSLILLAVGLGTNRWIVLHHGNIAENPTVLNTKLQVQDKKAGITSSTAEISYVVSHFGLWIGCHKEIRGAVSCSYIGASCFSNVCWIRKTDKSRTETCLDGRVQSVKNCIAYQATRVIVLLGALVLVFGIAMQVVSLVTINRALAMLAGVIIFGGGLLVMIAFAVFWSEILVKGELSKWGEAGYSLKLIISAWPLCMLAGVISCFAASMGLRHKDVSDYSASNY